MKVPDRAAVIAALRVRRNQVLLALFVLLVIVRIALPYILRPIIVQQADDALVGRIVLRDLDLSLIRGGVTLYGLEVYADELAPATSPQELKPPLFQTERLWVQISWLRLVLKLIDVEEFEIDDFTVRLDRLKDGLIMPKPTPSDSPEPPKPESQEPSGWSFGADSIVLLKGAIVFRDFTVGEKEPQRLDLAIPNLAARKLALRFDPSGAEPGHVGFEADIGGGKIGFEADMEQKEAGPATHSNIVIADLPIGDVRVYLKMFGWSDLKGTLDASIDHRFETNGLHQVSGALSLSNVTVNVPDLDHPALAFKKLTIGLDQIDVVKQHASVADVRLEGAHVVVDPKSKRPLLVLEPPAKKAEQEEPAAAAAAPAPPGKPWTWNLKRARLEGAEVELLGADKPLTLGVDAEVKNVADPTTGASPVSLAVKEGDGSLVVGGDLTLEPLSFNGKVGVSDFALAPLAARAPAPGADLLRGGKARADLEVILAGRGASAPKTSDLRVSGTLGIADLELGKPGDKQFNVTWKDLNVQLREATVLPAIGGDPAQPRAVNVSLQRVTLAEPAALLTRTADGLVLPSFGGEPAPAADESQPPVTPAAPAPAPDMKLRLDSFKLQKGRAQISDHSVTPFYEGQVEQLDVNAVKVTWPPASIDAFIADLKGLRGALLHVHGGIEQGRARVRAELTTLPLAPFNPYVSASGFSLANGELSLALTSHFEAGSYDSQTDLTIQSLEVGGAQGEALFEQNFGIPLSMAIGLLKNQDGAITLTVPVGGDRGGTRIGLASIAGQALRKALVGALASPLKLLGAGTKDGKVDLRPQPVEFQLGGAEPSESGSAHIDKLAQLLTASPGISLTLHGGTSTGDLRALRERALLEELDKTSGLRALGSIGEIGIRRAVRSHLEATTKGETPPPLDTEESEWLEAKLSAQSLPDAALEQLAVQRAEALHQRLVSEKGIEKERVTIGEPAPVRSLPMPGVAIDVGARPVAVH